VKYIKQSTPAVPPLTAVLSGGRVKGIECAMNASACEGPWPYMKERGPYELPPEVDWIGFDDYNCWDGTSWRGQPWAVESLTDIQTPFTGVVYSIRDSAYRIFEAASERLVTVPPVARLGSSEQEFACWDNRSIPHNLEVIAGLGRIVALHYRSSTSYQIC
jgi:hypothetical protein